MISLQAKPGLMLPWIILTTIGLVLDLIILILSLGFLWFPLGFLGVASHILGFTLAVYFLIVVCSYRFLDIY